MANAKNVNTTDISRNNTRSDEDSEDEMDNR